MPRTPPLKKSKKLKVDIPICNNLKDSFSGKDSDLPRFTFLSFTAFLVLECKHGLIIGIEFHSGLERAARLTAYKAFNNSGRAVHQQGRNLRIG